MKILVLSLVVLFSNILIAAELKLTILHTNDHHGRFFRNRHGEYGLAARKTMIDQLRAEAKSKGREVLLLSGGDINTGIPESDMLDAEPDFKGMNLLKYDAMAVGNHEFDNELETIFKQQNWAGFPFLSANIFYQEPVGGFFGFFTEKKPFASYILKKIKGVKIAIMGFTTADTPQKVNPIHLKNIEFRSPIKVAKTLVPKLKKISDLLIAVTHMGHFEDGKHGIDSPGDVTLARSIKGIDLIVGGHTQKALLKPDLQNGTLIVQAHEWGKFVGKIELLYKDGKVTLEDYRLVPINLKKKIKNADGTKSRVLIEKEITENKEMLALLTPYKEKGDKKLNISIGSTKLDLIGDRHIVSVKDTDLTRLINKAFKEELGGDISILNSGGVRASIEPGKITYRDILRVQPFGGTLAVVRLNGAELKEYLRKLVFSQPKASNGFPHFYGLSFAKREYDLVNIKIGNQPLSMAKMYQIVLPKFLATGGDKFPELIDHPGFNDSGFIESAVLKNYILKNKVITKELLK